jgi:hypothetical protein
VYVALERVRRACVVVCACAIPLLSVPAAAQTPQAGPVPQAQDPTPQQLREELERLRKEFESVRDTYGARLTALESKLAQMEGAAPAAAAAAQPTGAVPTPAVTPPGQTTPPTAPVPAAAGGEVQVPPGAAGAGGPQGSLPVYGSASALSKIFNPDIAVIGNFTGAAGSNTIDPLPTFQLGESEVSYQAVVDPYARADFFISFAPEGVEVEEGFITFTTLPGGFLAKVGKMREQIGKVNTMHAHVLPWVDEPIVLGNLLGSSEGIADSGISVSKLVLNPWFFLEATGEVYQGTAGTFVSHERSQISWVGRVRGYRDITESTNLDVGASFAHGYNDAGPDFTTKLFTVDATMRYRPLQRAIYRRFIGRTELFWSNRDQDPSAVHSFGMYGSGEYQFARRWFAGGRYDWSERAADSSMRDKGASAMLTYWPSEFSQIRGQYRYTRYAEGVNANEFLFQFLFSIGAHGAHVF